MNTIQRSTTIGSEISVFIRDWFDTKLAEPTHPNAPEQNSEVDEGQEPTHPVWNGELDEPIWW